MPDYVIACVGGGSNAIGAFSQYVADEEVKLVGVEAAGHGLDTDKHAATMTKGSIGIVDGMKTYAVFKEDGELAPVYSISAGLDYPGVGPEHAYFKDSGRVEYVAATDEEAVQALLLLSRSQNVEGFKVIHPCSKGCINRILKGTRSSFNCVNSCSHHLHTENIETLTLHILCPHVDITGHAKLGCSRCCRNTVLTSSCFLR